MDDVTVPRLAGSRGEIVLGGQPTRDDLRDAAQRGFRTIVNLRKPSEDIGFDEAACVRELGMQYVALGFKDASELTDEVFDRAREILRDGERMPLLLHCLSANRVGAVWLPHRVLDHGVDLDAAMLEAVEVGLRSDAYVDKARDYIARRRLH